MKRSVTLASTLSAAAAFLLVASVGLSADTDPAKPVGTASISGKVTDASGKAVANLKVSLVDAAAAKPKDTAKEPGAGKKGKMAAIAATTTDSEGAYKFQALAAGEYSVMAGDKTAGRGMAKVTLTDGQAATADITLKAPKAK